MKRIIIDGPNLTHRMRHACASLHANDGRPTGVLYGTLNAIYKLYDEFNPDEIVFTWEGGRSWRKDFYPPYKAQRAKLLARATDEEQAELEEFYKIQIPDTMEALGKFGIPSLQIDGLEADDVIALMTRYMSPNNQVSDTIIVSTDKDFLQLACNKTFEEVRIYNPQTEVLYFQNSSGQLCTQAEIIAPSPTVYLWRRYLVGDTSDNIKGVDSIGDKWAEKLLPVAARPGQSLADYVYEFAINGTCTNTKRNLVREAMLNGTFGRNVRLMNLSLLPPKKWPWHAEIRRTYWHGDEAEPTFIHVNIENEDPSPLTIFFAKRSFRMDDGSGQTVQKVLSTFRSLRNRHVGIKRSLNL